MVRMIRMMPKTPIVVSLIQSFFFLFLFFSSCAAPGPVLPELKSGRAIDAKYRFFPNQKSKTKLIGELVIQTQKLRPTESIFDLLVAYKNRNNSIRMKKYTGHAIQTANEMHLRFEKCYEFGKKEIEDRLVPFARFECDHLQLSFQKKTMTRWVSISNPSTIHTDGWLSAELEDIIQFGSDKAWVGQTFFSDEGRIIFFSQEAEKYVRNEQTLSVADSSGNLLGSVVIDTRIGDFVIASPRIQMNLEKISIAHTTEKKVYKGLFD